MLFMFTIRQQTMHGRPYVMYSVYLVHIYLFCFCVYWVSCYILFIRRYSACTVHCTLAVSVLYKVNHCCGHCKAANVMISCACQELRSDILPRIRSAINTVNSQLDRSSVITLNIGFPCVPYSLLM